MDIQYSKVKEVLLGVLFLIALIVTYIVYSPGLQGVFIFDDIGNISPLGKYPQFDFWDNFWLFLLEGRSGPTGRPISLASFYLNDISWPSIPSGFIYTNILLHIFNGALLFWFTLKLLSVTNKKSATSFALLVTTLWLLHPLHTTTVLYIVQRMTELSSTFILTGLIFYLSGRNQLIINNTKKGFITLFIGVGVSLLLAILSKENGILLVAYILVIEFFWLRPSNITVPKHFNYWFAPVVTLPFLFIIYYLGSYVYHSDTSFIFRDFTLTERLLTESRILFDYIYQILIPDMSHSSLFHDDYIKSKNIFSPWTTLASLIGIVSLIFLSFYKRNKHPVLAFSVMWFFAGHLLESTVIPLELYFEHRNYLPMYGIIFAIVWSIQVLWEQTKLIIIFPLIIISLFSFMVLQNSTLWGKPLELVTNWYNNHPNSLRTNEFYATIHHKYQLPIKESHQYDEESQFIAPSILFKLSRACQNNILDIEKLSLAFSILSKSRIHPSSATSLVAFLDSWKIGKCDNLNISDIEEFLLKLSKQKNVRDSSVFISNIYFQLALIYKHKRDFHLAITHLEKSYVSFPTFDVIKKRADYYSSAGLYDEALKVLDDTTLLETSLKNKLIMQIKQKELDQMKQNIRNTMINEK